ncbi:MAG TPA: ATP-grasp domain-containing protein [Verrucomicrobiae bacterium]|nr:ATP-grasp domain-containing protein [Verrucomicrobiae bacterium]
MLLESQTLTKPAPSAGLPTAGVGGVSIGGDFQGLGIARSLGRQGVPVCIIDNERSISRYSRYTTHSVRVKDLRDEQRTVETLMETGRRLGLKGWVLYPTRDETVAALSRHREILSEFFRVPTPGWESIKWAWDKRNTFRMAMKLGIPSPATFFPETVEELGKIDVRLPAVMKPAIKEHFIYTTKVKAWRADSRQELVDKFQEAATFVPAGEMMIQDMIPGGSEQQFGYCAFFKQGRALGSMVTQYKRQHPPQFGRSCTFVETIDLPILEELALRFLSAIGYYGLVELEFKLDPRDGQYKLLDVNARTWGYHTLGVAAGVDFSHMLFEDQLGRPVKPARARAGVTWLRWVTDLPVGIHGVFRRQWGVREYLRSVRRLNTESVFCMKDPLPSLVEAALIPYLAVTRGY